MLAWTGGGGLPREDHDKGQAWRAPGNAFRKHIPGTAWAGGWENMGVGEPRELPGRRWGLIAGSGSGPRGVEILDVM